MYCLRALMLVWTANLCTAPSECVLEWKLWRAGTPRHLSGLTAENGRPFRLETPACIFKVQCYIVSLIVILVASCLCKYYVIQRELEKELLYKVSTLGSWVLVDFPIVCMTSTAELRAFLIPWISAWKYEVLIFQMKSNNLMKLSCCFMIYQPLLHWRQEGAGR